MRILVTVLSSNRQPFHQILNEGQKPTWIQSALRAHTQVLLYSSDLGQNEFCLESSILNQKLRLSEFVNYTGLGRARVPRSRPSFVSRRLSAHSRELSFQVTRGENGLLELRSDIPDSLATVGVRTLEMFEYALANLEFDFLVRTNTSSFLRVEKLADLLDQSKSGGTVFAQTGSWGGLPYPSGALYILPRPTVQAVVDNRQFWIHDYIDDVALGLLLKKLSLDRYTWLPRVDFPMNGDTFPSKNEVDAGLHFRCKSSDPKLTISRMLRLHSMLGD